MKELVSKMLTHLFRHVNKIFARSRKRIRSTFPLAKSPLSRSIDDRITTVIHRQDDSKLTQLVIDSYKPHESVESNIKIELLL
jgi:hypothetical protein